MPIHPVFALRTETSPFHLLHLLFKIDTEKRERLLRILAAITSLISFWRACSRLWFRDSRPRRGLGAEGLAADPCY